MAVQNAVNGDVGTGKSSVNRDNSLFYRNKTGWFEYSAGQIPRIPSISL